MERSTYEGDKAESLTQVFYCWATADKPSPHRSLYLHSARLHVQVPLTGQAGLGRGNHCKKEKKGHGKGEVTSVVNGSARPQSACTPQTETRPAVYGSITPTQTTMGTYLCARLPQSYGTASCRHMPSTLLLLLLGMCLMPLPSYTLGQTGDGLHG